MASIASSTSGSMKVASFNILHGSVAKKRGSALMRRAAIPALTRDVASLEADLVALQEVDKHVLRTAFANIPKRVSRACGFESRFVRARRWHGFGQYGIALLSKASLLHVRSEQLPRNGRSSEKRVVVAATVDVDGKAWMVGNTHLSYLREESGEQLRAALQLFEGFAGPCVLLGDFNMRPHEITPLAKAAGWDVVDSPPTYPSWDPTIRIDFALVRGCSAIGVDVRTMHVSDHCALVVRLVSDS